jgi:predicted TPR repeat methyltransferase
MKYPNKEIMDLTKQYDFVGEEYVSNISKLFEQEENPVKLNLINKLPNLKGKIVLDVGCGDGLVIKRIENKCKDIYGIDSSKVMVSISKENVKFQKTYLFRI